MTKSKKVFPILVGDSLDLVVRHKQRTTCRKNNPLFSFPELAEFASELNKKPPTPTKPRAGRRPRCTYAWLSTSLSEICCISGVITVIIGSLTALAGLFPRNQVSLIYLLSLLCCISVSLSSPF